LNLPKKAIFDQTLFMPLVVERCVKPPGFIFAARTYRLVLNRNGLYLLHIGRAMGPKVRADGYLADKLAQSMISKMERKMMGKLNDREEGIDDANLDHELALSKKSRHYESRNEVELKFKVLTNGLGKLRLKGKGVNVRVEIQPYDVPTVEQILNDF
jgi:hypothetical protein